MPEFFFRGRQGAYSLKDVIGEEKNAEDSIQNLLANLVLDAKWAKWIFVSGTVVALQVHG